MIAFELYEAIFTILVASHPHKWTQDHLNTTEFIYCDMTQRQLIDLTLKSRP